MENNLVDIVRQIIDRIDLNIPVISVTNGVGVDKIFVCNTMHITIGKHVMGSYGFEYVVTNFSFNEWVEVVPYNHSQPFSLQPYLVAPQILFLHGSPASTNNEYLLVSQRTLNKTPFIWLLESYEYENLPLDSSVVASYDARLFFMDWANTPKWKNDQHNDLVIKPMENLSKAFINVIENDYTFKRLNGYKRRPRPRFGVEITDKGSDKTIIHEDLSGVDMSVTLEMFNTELCC